MRVFLDMVGCRLNQSEIETFANQFRHAGHTLVSEAGQADFVVVNTCTVTAKAASDSRQKIRQAAHAGASEIIATGCWASLSPEEAAQLPNVTRVVNNSEKDRLVADILGMRPEEFDAEPLARTPLPGMHKRTRAFIKVQDGCNNRCTFCITTLARGASRSRSIEEILMDIRAALAGGTREVVLTGVHLGSWGKDLASPDHLSSLILAILNETGVERLRLSSLEPWDLDEDFFTLWKNPRLCRHLHLPLQSGSATILRRMARKVTLQSFAHIVALARNVVPEMAITTDIIVGFPGEGELEFRESLNYVSSMHFAGGHVFSYSARPGTAAAAFPDQVAASIHKQRSMRMRAVLLQSQQNYVDQFLRSELDVLWESTDENGPEGWKLHGLTDNYLRVTAYAPRPLWNEITRVRLEHRMGNAIQGSIR